MTAFLLIAVLIAIAAAAIVLRPLFSEPRSAPASSAASRMDAMIGAVARDREYGLVGEDEAKEIETEIRSAGAEAPPAPGKVFRAGRMAAVAMIGLAPLAAGVLYLQIGTPRALDKSAIEASAPIAGAPESDPAAAIAAMPEADRRAMIGQMVEGLAQRLVAEPDDPDGWRMLARSYQVLGRFPESAAAWREALARSEGGAADWRQYAEALMGNAPPVGGEVSAELEAALEKVLSFNASDPMSLFVLGQAAFNRGDKARAVELWSRLRAAIPPDAPVAATLDRLIEDAK